MENDKTTYSIQWATGGVEEHDTYAGAVAAVEAVLSEAEIGHDGDITEGGDRTLFWASAEDAQGDDGSRAAGSIRARHG